MDPQSDVAERAPSRPLRADVARKGPVFVDLSGRRGRLVRHVGVVAGAACLGYSAVLGLGYAGGTPFAPQTLIPGHPVSTEAFGRGPTHTPEGRSGPSESHERRDAHAYGYEDEYGDDAYGPTERQHRRERHASGRPEHRDAREPVALPPITTRPRPAPPRPDPPKAPRTAPRHSPAHHRPGGRESAAGHRPGKHHKAGHTPSHPAGHPPGKRPTGASHTPSKQHPAGAEPPAKGSGHSQAPGHTTRPGHAASPQKPQSQKPPQADPPKPPKGPAGGGAPDDGPGAPKAEGEGEAP
ncbi:hypothetical protein [Streptomyces iranensis]|uniref:Translation initiation factor IF-2 n=1 Tax=Streptomyces iranensis TaxID=576784 RepID=A0ABS4N771_9ACTN|nr:hypothetical protein [Streptomyces iranensis]MBP2067264.1 hypothetical protein [Streptomyces iranensis]